MRKSQRVLKAVSPEGVEKIFELMEPEYIVYFLLTICTMGLLGFLMLHEYLKTKKYNEQVKVEAILFEMTEEEKREYRAHQRQLELIQAQSNANLAAMRSANNDLVAKQEAAKKVAGEKNAIDGAWKWAARMGGV